MLMEIDGAKNTSFCSPAKVTRTFYGDQSVTVEIDVSDGKMKHFVNGEEIMGYSNSKE